MGKGMGKLLIVAIITLSMMQVIIMGNSEKIIVDEFGSNILLGGTISNGIVKCIPNGEVCNDQHCCPGNICAYLPDLTGFGYCSWCPTAGYPCGELNPCCPGLTCDGFFSGTCH
ncbi:unnamed protein product [Amaranthus hypochondriacus]